MNQVYIKKLVNILKKQNLDAIFIAPSEEMFFLFGQSPSLCERFQGVFILKTGEMFYICNGVSKDEVIQWMGEEKTYVWLDQEGMLPTIKSVLESYDLIGKKIGVNSTARAFNILQIMNAMDVTFVNGKLALEALRMIKTDDELEGLRISSRINDKVMSQIIDYIKPGMIEKDVIEKLQTLYEQEGAEMAFAIVAAGPNSALPHYSETSGVIKAQDVLLLDIGCKYKGFCSDMTRTIFLGEPTEEQKKDYDIVLRAVLEAENKVKIGEMIPLIDKTARDIVDNEADKGSAFNTRLGHGVGYSVHEAPDVKATNHIALEENMVFSIEPGIYKPGKYGIRIEDLVTPVKEGVELLNHYTKSMIIK